MKQYLLKLNAGTNEGLLIFVKQMLANFLDLLIGRLEGFILLPTTGNGFSILSLLMLVHMNVIGAHGSWNCQHYHPSADEIVHGARIQTADDSIDYQLRSAMTNFSRTKRSEISHPLRISLVYHDSVFYLERDKLMLINDTVLPEAIRFWEQALLVRQRAKLIRLNRKCNSSKVFVKDGFTYCMDTCNEVTMCGEVQVPKEHLDVCRVCNSTGQNCHIDKSTQAGEGLQNTDFVFYVSARQTARCKGLTIAYAAHCQQEAVLDRPIAGHANLCPESISTKPQELQTLISTVKHEILHALGFSVSLYAFFRDENGKPRTPRKWDTGKPYFNESLQIHQWSNNTIRRITRKNWSIRGGQTARDIDVMVTPRVVDEVRKHFKCDVLEGAELEDQGGEGTALTHWEKRIFENEAMTGTHTQSAVFSRITLALMEDTGWYKSNYSIATPLVWGKSLGCNFVMRSCKDWIHMQNFKGRSIHPFCSKVKQEPLQTECTTDRNSVALCNLIRHSKELPSIYQNFDSIENVKSGEEGYYGGSVSLADHCPYIQEFTWRNKNVVVRGSHCRFIENNPEAEKNYALETYGTDSKCFDHGESMWEERTCHHTREWQYWGSGCYKYDCTDGRLHIQITDYNYTCYFPGQKLHISIMANGWLHKGSIVCPTCEEICNEHFHANNEKCQLKSEAPPLSKYHRDFLQCSSANFSTTTNLLLIIASFYIILNEYSSPIYIYI